MNCKHSSALGRSRCTIFHMYTVSITFLTIIFIAIRTKYIILKQ